MAPKKGEVSKFHTDDVLYLPGTKAWKESQERLEMSMGETLRNVAREEARNYFKQPPAESKPKEFATPNRVRKIPEGLSNYTIKLGPLPSKLYPKFVKQHFAYVGRKCGDGPLQPVYMKSTQCKTHGFQTFVAFETAVETDIALGLDSDEEEENCFTRHEINGEMIRVERAPATMSCCEEGEYA